MSLNSIIRRVSEYTDYDVHRAIEELNIMVVGVGGAGCNAITRMKKLGLDAPTVAINTDMGNLKMVDADKKILLKDMKGRGTGGNIEIGERSAVRAREEISEIFHNIDIIFLTTGLGGGTGTGASPVIAEIARKEGALVISIVTIPFNIEKARVVRAKEGLKKIMKDSNTVIVLENDKLMDIVPQMPLDKAFMVMDHLISYTIMSFIDMITKPSLINVDISDLRGVVERGNLSTILLGEGDINNPRKIVTDALNNPFMNVDYTTANGALIHLTVGEDATLKTIYSTVDTVSSFLRNDPKITMGARIEPEYQGRMRLLVVLTGIKVPLLGEMKIEKNLGIYTIR